MATDNNPDPVLFERCDRVVVARLNRPEALNALNGEVLSMLVSEFGRLDDDPDVGCFVVTGSDRAFAAGADITEMQGKTHLDQLAANYLAGWDAFAALRTPKLAAVAGYALGGGCELAMMCDVVYAADNARFGQPEIKLGLIPGMGGSQRLTRLVGRAKAMDMILTGRMVDAAEAERAGLAARVFDLDGFVDEVLAIATEIAGYAKPTAMLARDAVNQAEQTGLGAGLAFERHLYHSVFGTPGAVDGIATFLAR